jgi:hypothetical protein
MEEGRGMETRNAHPQFRELVAQGLGAAELELRAAQRVWPPQWRRVRRVRERLEQLERVALKLLLGNREPPGDRR